MARIQRNPKSVDLANRIIEEYKPQSIEDMQNALNNIFGPMYENDAEKRAESSSRQ